MTALHPPSVKTLSLSRRHHCCHTIQGAVWLRRGRWSVSILPLRNCECAIGFRVISTQSQFISSSGELIGIRWTRTSTRVRGGIECPVCQRTQLKHKLYKGSGPGNARSSPQRGLPRLNGAIIQGRKSNMQSHRVESTLLMAV